MGEITAIEHVTQSFYRWEERGRGYRVYKQPVDLEAPFEHFAILPFLEQRDSYKDAGEKTSLFDGLKESVKSFLETPKQIQEQQQIESKYSYPERPVPFENNQELKAYVISVPKGLDVPVQEAEQLLLMLSNSATPFSFEVIGTYEKIEFQFVCRNNESKMFISQFRSYFPDVAIEERNATELPFEEEKRHSIVDMGLQEEFMRPLNTVSKFQPDSLIGILATMEHLQYGEIGMVQILFQGCVNAWSSEVVNAVSDGAGGSFFADAPDMLKLAQEKVSKPLFACVVRVITQSNEEWKSRQLATNIFQGISTVTRSNYNALTPLPNEGYDYYSHMLNVYKRRSHRLGMLLNSSELVSLVHIPSSSVKNEKVSRGAIKTKYAPKELWQGKYLVGTNTHLGQTNEIYLDDEYKKRHIYCIGNTGMGKSTLIVNMLLDDAEKGNGVALFDPHGDVVDDVVARIPEHRRKDVILFDPSDSEFPIGFNLLQAKTDIEKIVLSSDLVEVFKARSTSWGDTMTSVLSNAINAFLESEQGGTLLELRRFLLDAKFREKYLETVEDYSIRSYWENDFKQLRKGAISPLLTRLDTFLRPKIVRNMMAQRKGIDFNEVLNGKKILLVKLSQGLIGEENSYLLGTLMLAKLQQSAQARASLAKEQRHPFYIYVDEFHNFVTPAMSQILSGARKYGLGLFLANQQLSQISSVSSAITDSVLSNPAIRICFRVGDNDARTLAQGFSSYEQNDLQNLNRGQCIVRVGSNTNDFNLNTKMFEKAIDGNVSTQYIVNNTRKNYASTKAEVEHIVQVISQFNLSKQKKQIKEIKEELKQEERRIPEILPTKNVLEIIEKENPSDVNEKAREFISKHNEVKELKEHQYLQEYLGKLAQQRGFKIQVEYPTKNGGRIDLVLIKNELKIAIEVSVTNTIDYEVKNLKKCLDERFEHIVMLSKSERHLQNIKLKAQKTFSKKHFEMIQFTNPENFVIFLDKLLVPKQSEKRVLGYRVKTNYSKNN